MRRAVRFAQAVALACIVVVVAAEGCIRIFARPPFTLGYLRTHPTRHYELTPGFRGRTYDVELAINSLGMRDVERTIDPGAYRIVVLGDSLTFGQGVAVDDLYVKRLERELSHGDRRVQVLNFATPGLNTVAEASLLNDIYDRVQPDLVLFQYTLLDDSALMVESRANRYRVVRQAKDFLRRFYVYDYLASRYYGLRGGGGGGAPKPGDDVGFSWQYADNFAGWVDCRRAFHDVAQLASQHHAQVVFAVFAYGGYVAPTAAADKRAPYVAKVFDALDEAGIHRHLLMDDALRDYAGRERELRVRPDDTHFNAHGHELLAAYLARNLEPLAQ